MSVGEICSRDVVVMSGEGSIRDAAELMRDYHVGDVVVVNEMNGARVPIGILTDRDITLEIVAKGVDPASIAVQDAMSFELVTVAEDEDLLRCIEVMREKALRRVPVVDSNGALVGILSVDDVIDVLAEMMTDIVRLVDAQSRTESRRRP